MMILCMILHGVCYALGSADSASIKIHTDFPYLSKHNKLTSLIYCSSDSSFKALLDAESFLYLSEKDSVLIFKKRNYKIAIKKGINTIKIDLSAIDSNTKYSVPYYEILSRTGSTAPGCYKTYISITKTANHKQFCNVLLQKADTSLAAVSPVRADINNSLASKERSFAGKFIHRTAEQSKSITAGSIITKAGKKIDKKAKQRGLSQIQYQQKGKNYIDYYYENWFAGRYEVNEKQPIAEHLQSQSRLEGAGSLNGLVANDLDTHPSLCSQFKTFKKQKDDNRETKGVLSYSTNNSTGQEPNSGIDNNYYEVKGHVETPIWNLPVEIEGLYTSQDVGRTIKSSYFRVHYDVAKVKEELSQFIGSYNQKYAETKSKSSGMEQIYQSSINAMEKKKASLKRELDAQQKATGDIQPQIADTAGIAEDIAADSSKAGVKTADKLKRKKAALTSGEKDAEEKYRKIEALNRKIEKYQLLLAQNRNTNYFDSALGYSKVNNIDYNNASYQQLTKRGTDFLPDGKAKKFVSGISTFDAGMFPKYSSKYSMSGQMVKGVDMGYDVGFCEVGLTAGKTEYIGRDGSLDKYTCYSVKSTFRLFSEQKMGLVYYGYTPDRKIFTGDEFFKNLNISAPWFSTPTHIVSANYDGVIHKFITINGEAATSFKKKIVTEGNSNPLSDNISDKMALHFSAEAAMPKTPVQLQATYDKTGKSFENSTLPVSLSGTEQYKLAGKTDIFHSFLTVGIDYNYLLQNNFTAKYSSTKWGFSLKTHSKRYPNAAISYKPFTTFRSYTDTLNVPQRPMLGAIWSGKLSYQLKQHGKSWRFALQYNKCTTIMDTNSYDNTTLQLMCIHVRNQLTASVNSGYTAQSGQNTTTVQTTHNKMKFLALNADYAISSVLSVSGGQEFGFAPFGFCRYVVNGGIVHHFNNKPIILRVNLRCNKFKLTEAAQWKELYSGNMELTYRFKAKPIKRHSIQ